jgi:hypothetical protein
MESWLDTIKRNNKVFLDSFKADKWKPSNWENIQDNPHCEDYKKVFLDIRYNGHIPHDTKNYFATLERYDKKYKSDKLLKDKVDKYLEMTELNYRSMKKGGWRNPFGELKAYGPKLFGLNPFCHYEETELGKEYKKLEFELKELFSRI